MYLTMHIHMRAPGVFLDKYSTSNHISVVSMWPDPPYRTHSTARALTIITHTSGWGVCVTVNLN